MSETAEAMAHDFKLGDRVARIDILGIKGTVTELRGGQVKVRWSVHCEWWILADRLIQVRDNKVHSRTLSRCLKKERKGV